MDGSGHIFLADEHGELFKIAQDGKIINRFAQVQSAIHQLDASHGLRVFAFLKDFQNYLLLDRNLGNHVLYSFKPDQVGYATAATLGADNSVWLIDQQDMSLKKYDLRIDAVTIASSLYRALGLAGEARIYEHQNRIYIANSTTGLLCYDNLGNHLRSYEVTSTHLSFQDGLVYFMDKGHIVSYDLYTGEKCEWALPAPNDCQLLLVQGKQFFVFNKRQMYVLQ
jgi:outer membrane protein assembly factor BamB